MGACASQEAMVALATAPNRAAPRLCPTWRQNSTEAVVVPRSDQPTVDWTPTISGSWNRPRAAPSSSMISVGCQGRAGWGSSVNASRITAASEIPTAAELRKPMRR